MNAGTILRWGFMILFGSTSVVCFITMVVMLIKAFMEDAGHFMWAFIAFLLGTFAGMYFLALVYDPPGGF